MQVKATNLYVEAERRLKELKKYKVKKNRQ